MLRAVNIGDKTYNIVQATATEQKTLMLLLGAKIAFNSNASGIEKIDTACLVGSLLTMPEEKFDRIASIVLKQAVDASKPNEILDVKSFQGSMLGYFNLVAEAIAYNLDDFFTWLDSERHRNASRAPEANL